MSQGVEVSYVITTMHDYKSVEVVKYKHEEKGMHAVHSDEDKGKTTTPGKGRSNAIEIEALRCALILQSLLSKTFFNKKEKTIVNDYVKQLHKVMRSTRPNDVHIALKELKASK